MIWRNDTSIWVYIAVAVVLVGFAYQTPIQDMVRIWNTSEEYGYGYLIPVISLFLIWQQKNQLAEMEFHPSVMGLLLIVAGRAALFLG